MLRELRMYTNVHVLEFFILLAIQGTLNQRNRSNSKVVIAVLGYWIVLEHVEYLRALAMNGGTGIWDCDFYILCSIFQDTF